jgi:hypothetical protein
MSRIRNTDLSRLEAAVKKTPVNERKEGDEEILLYCDVNHHHVGHQGQLLKGPLMGFDPSGP